MKNKFIYILLFILFSNNLYSQSNCGWTSLDDASTSYEYGNFIEAIKIINKCIYTGFDEKQQVEGFRILAKTYLAMDNDSSAGNAVYQLLEINPKFQPDYLSDPPKFISILEQIVRRSRAQVVTSVSKKEENINLAPATVIVVTNEQFKRRGYTDYEALLHDLPGFDISRSNGNLYSHIYQRGYRSINTNRTLFLIDGVEENDLWSSNVYLSRQYSLSNLKNIEVVYGPASTMYGSNAFLGVVNIVTKDPQEMVKPGEIFGMNVMAGYGSYNTKYLDATFALASKNRKIGFSFTARSFMSDEHNLSEYSEYDYEPKVLTTEMSNSYHNTLDITNADEVTEFLASNPTSSDLYSLNSDNHVILTPLGIQRALDLDNDVYDKVQFSDYTSTMYYNAKLKIHDFLIGVTFWEKDEGPGAQYNEQMFMSSTEGQNWSPIHQYLYVKYDKEISPKIQIFNFLRFKSHKFDSDNGIVRYRKNYSTGNYNLFDLIEGNTPQWDSLYLFQESNQLREELRVFYQPNGRINILSGVEARFSSIQGDYRASKEPNAEESGFSLTDIPGGNNFYSRDIGVFVQSEIKLIKHLKLTTGLRFDNNRIRQTSGYGSVLNPRLALVYTPKNYVFKVIYAEAFKDATNKEKFSTASGKREIANPDLQPEKVKNYELIIGRTHKNILNFNTSFYYSHYSNIIQEVAVLREDGTYTNQNQAKGQAIIYGINSYFDLNLKSFYIYANYTYTEPNAINPTDDEGNPLTDGEGNPYTELRIGDIAQHSANAGINYTYKKSLNFNFRTNFIGKRYTGEGTTVPYNLEVFDPYILLDATISYSLAKNKITLQFSVNNILDSEYYSPGLGEATGVIASQLIQNGRVLRIGLNFNL